MKKLLFLPVLLCALAGGAACAAPSPSSGGPSAGGSSGAAPTSPAAVPSSSGGAVGAPEPSDSVSDFHITYGFGVPTAAADVAHPFTPPPLRTLTGIYAGDHPAESPAYQRMSFYFKGGYPSYTFQYVASVVSDGSGAPVSLPGNVFLRVVFKDAGKAVTVSPPATIGLPNLRGYAPAGDFEGHVTYGLGLQGATRPQIRSGELTRADPGGTVYVVFIDVRTTA